MRIWGGEAFLILVDTLKYLEVIKKALGHRPKDILQNSQLQTTQNDS